MNRVSVMPDWECVQQEIPLHSKGPSFDRVALIVKDTCLR